MFRGGIDVGGTKIAARLFDAEGGSAGPLVTVPTPGTAEAVTAAIADLAHGLDAAAGAPTAIGVALPGHLDPGTGQLVAANLALGGTAPAGRIAAAIGRPVPLINDGSAFALSEARGGAADGARLAVALAFGTGLGGGVTLDGALLPRARGLGLEIGHVGVPADALARHGLPALPCGCGRSACFERYVSGTGLFWLVAHLSGARVDTGALSDHPDFGRAVAIWADLAGLALATVQATLDPDIVVAGGGLMARADLLPALSEGFARHAIARPCPVASASLGAGSGARGAALAAAPC